MVFKGSPRFVPIIIILHDSPEREASMHVFEDLERDDDGELFANLGMRRMAAGRKKGKRNEKKKAGRGKAFGGEEATVLAMPWVKHSAVQGEQNLATF